MANTNPTVIAAHLDDKELVKSIDALVWHVEESTKGMAKSFDSSVRKMNDAMKDFAVNQKVSVSLMKDAWREMSSAFDAMVKAQEAAKGSGSGIGGSKASGVSIAELRNNINITEQEIQAINNKNMAWRKSREMIIAVKQELRSYRADVELFEYETKRGDTHSPIEVKMYERGKQKVVELTNTLKKLWSERSNIPAPSKEDLQKYDELQRKLVQLKESLNNALTPKTVGDLEKQISLEQQYRKGIELSTEELREQNQLIANQKAQLKDELMTEEEKKKALEKQTELLERQKAKQLKVQQQPFTYNFNKANSESSKDLASAEQKLIRLKKAVEDMRKSGLFDDVKLNKAQKAIDTLEQKIERMRAKRPMTMKDVLGMDENSVDAIAKKMQALKRVQIDPNNAAQVRQLGMEYQRLSKLQNEMLGRNLQQIQSNNALARSFGYIRNRIAYALTLGAATSFVKQIYEIRSQYELLERSLGVLVNSFEQGSRIFQELNQMALQSPFTLIELGTAAKQLTAYNFSAKEVVDTTRRLADISAALGVPMERLTYNLGQIRAQTVLTARDARDFANAGLPIVKSLADHFSELEGRIVTTGEVYGRMSKKMVSYNDVMQVLNKMTDEGGKFFDFQAKQAETLKVQLANLSLAWNNLLNEVGSDNQGLITAPIKGLKALFENWKAVVSAIEGVAVALGSVKIAQILTNNAINLGTMNLKNSILADKQKIATELQRKSLTEQLNVTEKNLLATRKMVTATDYQSTLATRNLTKTQAFLLLAINRNNKELAQALINMNLLTAAEIKNMTAGKAFVVVLRGMALSLTSVGRAMTSAMMSLATNPLTWWIALVSVITNVVQTISKNKEEIENFNNTIAEGAKESAKAFSDLLKSPAMVEAKMAAQSKSLKQDEAEKTWDSLREQIELSAASADTIIPKLLSIKDINERVTAAFDVAEKIQAANDKLSDLIDELDFNQDSAIWGLFGEGLIEDIEDYNDHIKTMADHTKMLEKQNAGFWERLGDGFSTLAHGITELFGSSTEEATEEVKRFAQDAAEVIREELGAEASAEEINEAIARTMQGLEKMFPQLKGKGKKLFEAIFNDEMAKEFEGDVDRQAYYYKIFLDRLKKDHGSAFQDVTDGILEDTHTWSEAQLEALNETAEKIKQDLPESSQQAITAIQKQLNSQPFKLYFIAQFQTPEEDVLNKEFRKQFIDGNIPLIFNDKAREEAISKNAKKYQVFLRKAGEDDVAYQKRISEEREKNLEISKAEGRIIEKNRNNETAFSQILVENATRAKKASDDFLAAAKEVEEKGGFDFSTKGERKKKKGSKGTKKDELGEAFQKEIEVITNIQKRYKEYRQAGVSAQEAITKATQEYGKTLANTNATLNRYGVTTTKSGAELAKMDLRDVRSYYTSLLEMAQKAGNVKGIEALEKAIAGLNVEIAKIDYKKITDGLNNELSKLKDEYELAVELDANPKLGNMFADIFNIDTSVLPRNIYEYVQAMQDAADKAVQDAAQLAPYAIMKPFDLLRGDINKWSKETGIEIGSELAKGLVASQKQVQSSMKKYLTDIEKETRDLQYKLSDNNDKIALEEEKRMMLETKLLRETTEEKRQLLQLQIENQKNTIAELRAVLIQEIPEYAAVFNSVIEHSAYMSKKLIADLRKIYDAAKKRGVNSNGYYTITSLVDGKETLVGKRQFEKELEKLTREERKVQSPFDKIKEAFSKDEITGKMVDFAKGVELVAGEAKKAADGLRTVADIVSALGGSDEAVETLNDIANSIEGVATAAEGVTQIQSGDFIGGTVNVIKGTWQAISTWFDNSNKKIDRQVQDSEERVKRLETAYKSLENTINDAYGTATIGATKAALANKELQLAELKRQLSLEQSRKAKNRDEGRIEELRGQIIDLERSIKETTDGIVNDLLGISSIGDAAENFMSVFVDALRNGDDAMASFKENMDDMIANMVKKMLTTKIIQPWFEKQWNTIQEDINKRGADSSRAYEEAQRRLDRARQVDFNSINSIKEGLSNLGLSSDEIGAIIFQDGLWLRSIENIKAAYMKELAKAEKDAEQKSKELARDTQVTVDDIKRYAELLRTGQPIMDENMSAIEELLRELGLINDKTKENSLSALQQGITGITEDTASAIEAYMNIVAQRVFEHGIILTEIRDAVISFDMDVQLGTMSQILLQLQASYQTQAAIQTILEGVLTPSGRAFMVELNS